MLETNQTRSAVLSFLLLFGVTVPFMMAAVREESKVPNLNLEKYVSEPKIFEVTDIKADYLGVGNDPYEWETKNNIVRPRYGVLLQKIKDYYYHKSFLNGNNGTWSNIVLLNILCIMQASFTLFVYGFMTELRVVKNLMLTSIVFFVFGLLTSQIDAFTFLFYYILPVPALIIWLGMGLNYVKHLDDYPVQATFLLFSHYIGILPFINLMFTEGHKIPWLIGG